MGYGRLYVVLLGSMWSYNGSSGSGSQIEPIGSLVGSVVSVLGCLGSMLGTVRSVVHSAVS